MGPSCRFSFASWAWLVAHGSPLCLLARGSRPNLLSTALEGESPSFSGWSNSSHETMMLFQNGGGMMMNHPRRSWHPWNRRHHSLFLSNPLSILGALLVTFIVLRCARALGVRPVLKASDRLLAAGPSDTGGSVRGVRLPGERTDYHAGGGREENSCEVGSGEAITEKLVAKLVSGTFNGIKRMADFYKEIRRLVPEKQDWALMLTVLKIGTDALISCPGLLPSGLEEERKETLNYLIELGKFTNEKYSGRKVGSEAKYICSRLLKLLRKAREGQKLTMELTSETRLALLYRFFKLAEVGVSMGAAEIRSLKTCAYTTEGIAEQALETVGNRLYTMRHELLAVIVHTPFLLETYQEYEKKVISGFLISEEKLIDVKEQELPDSVEQHIQLMMDNIAGATGPVEKKSDENVHPEVSAESPPPAQPPASPPKQYSSQQMESSAFPQQSPASAQIQFPASVSTVSSTLRATDPEFYPKTLIPAAPLQGVQVVAIAAPSLLSDRLQGLTIFDTPEHQALVHYTAFSQPPQTSHQHAPDEESLYTTQATHHFGTAGRMHITQRDVQASVYRNFGKKKEFGLLGYQQWPYDPDAQLHSDEGIWASDEDSSFITQDTSSVGVTGRRKTEVTSNSERVYKNFKDKKNFGLLGYQQWPYDPGAPGHSDEAKQGKE